MGVDHSAEGLARGREVYLRTCAVCHGEAGEGAAALVGFRDETLQGRHVPALVRKTRHGDLRAPVPVGPTARRFAPRVSAPRAGHRLGPLVVAARPRDGCRAGTRHAQLPAAGLTAARLVGRLIGADLVALGIDVNCAPVADLVRGDLLPR